MSRHSAQCQEMRNALIDTAIEPTCICGGIAPMQSYPELSREQLEALTLKQTGMVVILLAALKQAELTIVRLGPVDGAEWLALDDVRSAIALAENEVTA